MSIQTSITNTIDEGQELLKSVAKRFSKQKDKIINSGNKEVDHILSEKKVEEIQIIIHTVF